MTRTVTRQHHGDRIVANVPTRDHYSRDLGTRSRFYAPDRISRDSTLAAVPVGHITDMGIAWIGDLEARAMRALDEVNQLVTPLTDPRIGGRKLEAEGTGPVLDLGTVHDGLARAARGDQAGGIAQIERAVADAKKRVATGDSAKWGERAVARSRQAQEDACSRMRAAADALWGTGATTDAAAPAVKSGPMTNEEINKLNRDFWAEQAKR
ncbi:MAG: hypothetical protein WCA14_02465 [Steroidobacteraceae bacterium]